MSGGHRLELENFLPYRFNRLADAVSRDFARIYREKFGLTRPEWRLLATLGQYGTMTATAVGQHSSMHKTKVSRAVTALEQRRWLRRTPDPNDRRVEQLALTRAGESAYGELVPLAHGFEQVLLARMSERERSSVLAGLAAIERVLVDA
ncbi:MarR family transcriptional regulator [Mesorhizobium sp. CAU 1741]|uniref:MarR family winged helix-turn-helix transcriptional regulator n=1 Tax=Mesorhizobium sp. CAU 1741 TaxID=3140366 RepID=UPI00325B8414